MWHVFPKIFHGRRGEVSDVENDLGGRSEDPMLVPAAAYVREIATSR